MWTLIYIIIILQKATIFVVGKCTGTRKVWKYQKGNHTRRKSKKYRQHTDHKKKDKMTNNDLQNITL